MFSLHLKFENVDQLYCWVENGEEFESENIAIRSILRIDVLTIGNRELSRIRGFITSKQMQAEFGII